MATVTRVVFSSSSGGQPIQVAQLVTPGTPIHLTAGEEEIYLEAVNNHASTTRNLTIEFGGTGAANEITVDLPPKVGLMMVINGMTLETGKQIGAYVDAGGSDVNIIGQVNVIVD